MKKISLQGMLNKFGDFSELKVNSAKIMAETDHACNLAELEFLAVFYGIHPDNAKKAAETYLSSQK